MLFVKRHGNPPLKGGAGNAEILKTRLNEIVDHFLFPGLGLYEAGMRLDVLEEAILVCAHPEEVCLFFFALHRGSAVRTLPARGLRFRIEGFAVDAVPTLIFVFVDVTLVVEALEDLLNRFDVLFIRGPDKMIVAAVHQVPEFPDFGGYAVHICLRGDPRFFRVVFNFFAVLVRPCQKKYVVSLQLAESGDRVRHDDFIGVADMGLPGCVRNRGCDIEFFSLVGSLFIHVENPPDLFKKCARGQRMRSPACQIPRIS